MNLPALSAGTAGHLLHDYVMSERSRWCVLKASGDRLRDYLQGQITQDIRGLTTQQGIHACLLTPQGKAVSTLYLIDTGAALLILTPATHAAACVSRLRRFALGYELRVGVVDTLGICSIQGADAAQGLAAFGLPQPGDEWLATSHHAGSVALVMPAEPRGFWVITEKPAIRAQCTNSPHYVDETQMEAMRIIRGLPDFGVEWDEKIHPLNANLIEMRGVSFDKGCYVGQEVTSRMRWRGGIRKKLYRVLLAGVPEALPCPLLSASSAIGELRSAAMDHRQQCYGIAWLPVEIAEKQTALALADGSAVEILEPCHV